MTKFEQMLEDRARVIGAHAKCLHICDPAKDICEVCKQIAIESDRVRVVREITSAKAILKAYGYEVKEPE